MNGRDKAHTKHSPSVHSKFKTHNYIHKCVLLQFVDRYSSPPRWQMEFGRTKKKLWICITLTLMPGGRTADASIYANLPGHKFQINFSWNGRSIYLYSCAILQDELNFHYYYKYWRDWVVNGMTEPVIMYFECDMSQPIYSHSSHKFRLNLYYWHCFGHGPSECNYIIHANWHSNADAPSNMHRYRVNLFTSARALFGSNNSMTNAITRGWNIIYLAK